MMSDSCNVAYTDWERGLNMRFIRNIQLHFSSIISAKGYVFTLFAFLFVSRITQKLN